MAQIEIQPLLSLCIPIYYRQAYQERQLARMSEDKDLFEEKIRLFISDNCLTDDLQTCCEKYQQKGLKLICHRNETNLGPDGILTGVFIIPMVSIYGCREVMMYRYQFFKTSHRIYIYPNDKGMIMIAESILNSIKLA